MFRSEVYCPSYRDVRFIVCPSYRDFPVNNLVCRGGLHLYSWYYYLFKLRFTQTFGYCLNQMIRLIGTEDEK